ncbi:MAG TPA: hypothetical protein VFG04_24220 [Planctomycetaceae bacterium]|nr:hypothetical protein [Planctomycetaceae bacterium]
MQNQPGDGRAPARNALGPLTGGTQWWASSQPPPVCPTCHTYVRCRRTMLEENTRVQYRYCKTCDYRIKTIFAVR